MLPAASQSHRPPALIVVHGLPVTGKTSLARRIAAQFGLPLFTKDGYKEILFDHLGWGDRAWSQKLSRVSFDLLFYAVSALLAAGQPAVIEGNFNVQRDGARLQAIAAACPYRAFQVLCWAPGEVLYQRLLDRAISGGRHPGHGDLEQAEVFREMLRPGRAEPLSLEGPRLEIDCTDFSRVDYQGVLQEISAWLAT